MEDFVDVYRKDSLNDLMRVSKEHYEKYKDRFVLNTKEKEVVVEDKNLRPLELKKDEVKIVKRTTKTKV